ncbi:hypothetical protein HYH03_004494 [Edaphochlamys debaryana]|uniref:Uncharacterized protein n=1 Tax=Edaphochlamys debaryana TaxID=47281 RepID=A0A835YEI6_9CHLO|nr:hypothetical protein HYH03_004494 [Edaphochlamys debaryana]|eukprot:KAG2497330.1 hypothetical protein HYH03_004494 [Edaphochlamys debaryana]
MAPKSKVNQARQQLEAAEEDIRQKERQLAQLKEQVVLARGRINELEADASTSARLEDDVQTLLQHQQRTASAFKDYENRVLALELQGLVERWRAMDVEELAQQNHDLREECMRLQQENMGLSRTVAEHSLSARRDLARIELALELTVKEKMAQMHDRLRQELYDEMDDKTKAMVAQHGELQDHVAQVSSQAATLDRQFRQLQAERARFKVDADLASGLGETQAVQMVGLKKQLQQAYQVIDLLRRRLGESEARAQAAWDEAVRAGSRAAAAAARAAGAGGGGGGGAGAAEADADSAYGMAGEAAEVAALEAQLRHSRQRFERLRLQRDRWRERSTLYEKACAQLQAALMTLQDQIRMPLAGGAKADLSAIWSSAPRTGPGPGPGPGDPGPSPGPGGPADDGAGWGRGSAVGSSRPSTAGGYSEAGAPHGRLSEAAFGAPSGMGSGHGIGLGYDGWPSGGSGSRERAMSARPAAGGGGGSGRGLPARPQTAVPAAGSPTVAARRTADAIRSSILNAPPAAWAAAEADAAAAAAVEGRSVSPPGRVGVSRLYSNEAEPFAIVRQLHREQPGWPTVPELRATSPTAARRLHPHPATLGATAAAAAAALGAAVASAVAAGGSPLAALAAAPSGAGGGGGGAGAGGGGGMRRAPGSVRPHSALPVSGSGRSGAGAGSGWGGSSRPVSASPGQGVGPGPGHGPGQGPAGLPWFGPGRSLTGLTSSSPASAAPEREASGGSGGAAEGAAGPGPGSRSGSAAAAGSGSGGGGGSGMGPGGVRSLTPSPPRQWEGVGGEVQGVLEAEWQSWQHTRGRAQSPESAALARSTAAAAAAVAGSGGAGMTAEAEAAWEVEAAARYGVTVDDLAGRPGPAVAAAAAAVATAGPVPAAGLAGGAIYAVVRSTAVGSAAASSTPAPAFAAAGGGAGSGPYGAATSAAMPAPVASLAAARSPPPPPPPPPGSAPVLANPSNMLAALRRPPSAMAKLTSAGVMFQGGAGRAQSARGGGGGGGGGGGAAGGAGGLRGSRGNLSGGSSSAGR